MGNPFFARYREQNALSRRQLAERLGISEGMVGHIERGIRGVTVANAKAWAEILGVSPIEILFPESDDERAGTECRS